MNKKKIDLSLVLACYNEGPTLADSVKKILGILNLSKLTYEVIFIDDRSSDDTPQLIKKLVKKDPLRLKDFFHEKNMRRGATVTEGIKRAKGIVVGYIDVDCEVSPVYIPEMVNCILEKKSDLVIGNRIYRSSVSGVFREAMSVLYKKLANKLLDTEYLDTESGYKFFRRSKILPVLEYADNPHWFWDTQIVVVPKLMGLKIVQFPVLFIRRTEKKSTVKVFRDSLDYLVNLWRFSKKIKSLSL